MARSTWTPPPRPNPDSLKNPTPFPPCKLSQLRAGKIKKLGPFESAIFKSPLSGPVTITTSGIVNDEHAYEPHRSPDKALLHYCSAHYKDWSAELPQSAGFFKPGAFGENMFNDEMSEFNVCIGDVIAIGNVVVEVTEPRAPCFKLNHRFEVKDMAKRSQTLFRTGWLYRVLKPGIVREGDEIKLLERPLPEWSVARVMYYLFLETDNVAMMKEIVALEPLGFEIKGKFEKRLSKGKTEDQDERMFGDVLMDKWGEYKIVKKEKVTSSVVAFTLEALDSVENPMPILPGSHVRLKLGGSLVRAYSVVRGTNTRFELGIALNRNGRGGSRYLHNTAQEGQSITCSQITTSFPLIQDAKRHVIIAAGIGITAFITALETLVQMKRDFHLHYAHTGEMPFEKDLLALGDRVSIYDKSLSQRMDIEDIIAQEVDCNTHIYTCGPDRLMDTVSVAATKLEIPDSHIHKEQFTVTTSGDPFTVELKDSKKTVDVGASESLLDVLRKIGLHVDSSCEVGNCGTCKVDVCSGRVEHRGTGLMEDEKKESMLSCVSRGIGRIVIDI